MQALEWFLHALDVPAEKIPTTLEERAALYRSLLDRRRVLVVLDNANTTEQVRPLLPGSPGCLVVVTSRNRLAGLIARDGARPVNLGALPLAEAITLLRQIIGRPASRWSPTWRSSLPSNAPVCHWHYGSPRNE